MTKKMIVYMIALAFLCLPVLFFASCASQQVTEVSEVEKPPEKPPEKVEAPPKEPEKEKPPAKVEPEETEEYKAREAERQRYLDELARKQREADEVRMFEAESIYFDFDKSDLKPPAKEVLKGKADWLRDNPTYSVIIEGHCDERGTNEYNLALGDRRANSAKRFLMALGVSEERMSTISYGEERPADPGHNEVAWAKNRRDEFKLIK